MKKFFKNSIVMIGLTFLLPGILALITKDSFSSYKELVQPKFAPPAFIFPIAWLILYILMSIAGVIAKNKDEDNIGIYYFQLILNAIWTPIFFYFKNYLLALIDLVVLLISVIIMIRKYKEYDKRTLYLLIPYLLWLLFALYLNFFIFIYN